MCFFYLGYLLAFIDETVLFRRSIPRDTQITFAPDCAIATAQAWPIPEDAPVTNARFPFNENEGNEGKIIYLLQLGKKHLLEHVPC